MGRAAVVASLCLICACGLSAVGEQASTDTGTSASSSSGGSSTGGVPESPSDAGGSSGEASDASADAMVDACSADVATDLANCGGCGKACPVGSDKCVAGVCYASLHIEVAIDGQTDLVITGGTVKWHHYQYVPPTATTLDGVVWNATWPASPTNCMCDSTNSTTITPPVPAKAQTATMVKTAGRSPVSLGQPTAGNGYELRVKYYDNVSGSDNYDVTVTYESR
jgi:hypothetical protein